MITYWSPEAGSFTVRNYLKKRGLPIAAHFTIRHFEEITPEMPVRGPAHIFSALDQVTPAGRALVEDLWDRLGEAAPGWTRLNDPRRVLLREPLLTTLVDAGLNDFRVFPGTLSGADLTSVRYPVFLRERDRHNGPLTGLIDSPGTLRRARRALQMRGYRAGDLLVVEFLDTADDQGSYRKYSAYRVGAAIVRTHLMVSRNWSVKSDSNAATLESAAEESEYLHGDAHETWLRRAFDLARIDFGRIDYGVHAGRPQAWEINMNPTIGRPPEKAPRPVTPDVQEIREAARTHAHGRLRNAFLALDAPEAIPPHAVVTLPPRLVRAVQGEQASAHRRARALAALQRAFHSPLGWPVRAVYGRVFRRM